MILCALGGISKLQLPVSIVDSRLGAWLRWLVVIPGSSLFNMCEILPTVRILVSIYIGDVKRTYQIRNIIKSSIIQSRWRRILTGDTCQIFTVAKATIPQRCHGQGNGNACQTAAVLKTCFTQRCHGRGNGNACQTAAVVKTCFTQRRHGRRDANACQTAAIIKAPFTQGCHGRRDGNVCQTGTAVKATITE